MRDLFQICAAISLVGSCAGCSTSYDFRSDDRPAYENIISAKELISLQQQGATVLDVRLLEDFNADPVLIPDAIYRDPENIDTWVGQMSPDDGSVVVYCVRGKWVSQKAANYLKDHGFDVYSLDGGIEGWKSSGRQTSSLDEADDTAPGT